MIVNKRFKCKNCNNTYRVTIELLKEFEHKAIVKAAPDSAQWLETDVV